jgi:CO/xanthine dehydrogenase Mo-binding subunit
MTETPQNGSVGTPFPIDDAALKATGQLRYVDDLKFPGLLYGKLLFSPVPHARIKRIDASAAEAMEGVHAVVTCQNTPAVYYNSSGETLDIFKTERVFDDTVRFIGDRVAAVAAETPALAAAAVRAIRVEYDPLPVNFDPEAGMRDDAYVLHTHGGLYKGNLMEVVRQSCGNVDEAMQTAPHVFEDEYTVPRIHHGALEPHGSVAFYDAGGKLTVCTSSQDSFAVRVNLSRIFSLPMSRVRVRVPAVGGAFGGKVDMITEPVAAALSIQCGRPVKLVFTRREDIVSSRTRHAMKIRLKMGIADDGTILAEDMRVYCNAGAYASGTSNIVWAMCGKFFKVHRCKNMRFTGYPVVTNTPLGGPMRGFGSPQTFFAQQRLMNRAAKTLGMDMPTLQRINLTLPDGLDYRFGQPHGNARPVDCLNRAAELIGYEKCLSEQAESASSRLRIGVGVSVGAHGNGMFGIRTDVTAMMLKMNDDGSCVLFSGSHEMGNASITLQKQVISEVLGLPMEMISVVSADTELTPYQLGDYSSRGAFVSGRAALLVAEDMRKKLAGFAAGLLGTSDADFTFSGGHAATPDGKSATLGEIVQFARHKKLTELVSEKTAASPASVISYGAHIVKVRVDTLSGKVELLDYAAVHDVGRAINPLSVRGQIEGAIQMGAGYALTEGILLDENGRVKNATLRTYRMLRANEMPKRLMIDLIEEIEPTGPFGAKSIGECSVVPAAAAVANAVSNAVGRPFNDLPVTPERILAALKGDFSL